MLRALKARMNIVSMRNCKERVRWSHMYQSIEQWGFVCNTMLRPFGKLLASCGIVCFVLPHDANRIRQYMHSLHSHSIAVFDRKLRLCLASWLFDSCNFPRVAQESAERKHTMLDGLICEIVDLLVLVQHFLSAVLLCLKSSEKLRAGSALKNASK